MRNYIKNMTDEKIIDIIINNLKEIEWDAFPFGNINNLDDVTLKRFEDKAELTIFFNNALKQYKRDKYVEEFDTFYERKKEKRVFESIVFDSYGMQNIILSHNENELQKLWRKSLYKEFGESYLRDFKKYKLQILEEEIRAREEELNNEIENVFGKQKFL